MKNRKRKVGIAACMIFAGMLSGCADTSITETDSTTASYEMETEETADYTIEDTLSEKDSENSSQSNKDSEKNSQSNKDSGNSSQSDESSNSLSQSEKGSDNLSQTDGWAEQTKEQSDLPEVPSFGSQMSDFVPDGWILMDSVMLDFNQDGIADYVGVLENVNFTEMYEDNGHLLSFPRILFAIASEGENQYRLDFQDMNLIRNYYEGGTFGDPYEPLTAAGTSFTTHSFGGSAWKWSEAYTYTYKEGIWYLTSSETINSYGAYITDHCINDYESGVGIRSSRSSDFGEMNDFENGDYEEDYDVTYEISLDEPLTISQAGLRWWLSTDRVAEWPVEAVEIMEGAELSENMVKLPEYAGRFDYCDENYLLYTFTSAENHSAGYYLALYRRQDKTVSVIGMEDSYIDSSMVYKDKIYYYTDMVENITIHNSEGNITKKDSRVGVRLFCMNLDGTDKKEVFAYRLPGTENEMRKEPPYLSLIYDISGDEIIVQVYIEDCPDPFYRMKLDGSGVSLIGYEPKME